MKKQQWKSIAITVAVACIAVLTIVSSTLYLLFGSLDNGWKMARSLYLVRTQYVHRLDSNRMMEGMLSGLLKSTDDVYSEYLSQESYRRLQEAIEGTHVGVGLLLSQKDSLIYVQEVIPGGNAEKAGVISIGDRIDQVDGKTVADMDLTEVVKRISGQEGTQVTLNLCRTNGESYSQVLVRGHFIVPTVSSRLLKDSIAYVRIRSFTEETPMEFRKEFEQLRFHGMRKLIIDLRNNPGGSLHAVREVGKQLLPQGIFVTIISRNGDKDVIRLPGAPDAVPLVILINRNSASASEILASAVQDLEAGKIVGEKSYGKGTVQGVFSLSAHDGIRLTVAEYFSPKGHSINGRGVIPDIYLDNAVATEDQWLEAAMQTL